MPRTPVTTPSRWTALAVLCAGTLMIILDGSIVTVALPAIQNELGFSDAGLTWTVNAYLIAFGGLLLLAGRLGDLLGRRHVLLAGLAVFTAASVLCGIAANPATLVAARFVQGAGGAMVAAVSLGMIVALFPEPGERGRALGAYAFTGSAGASIGQVLGGVLTDSLGWHWIFLINLPIGLATAFLSVRVLHRDTGPGLAGGADALGAALVTGGVMLGVYTIVQAEGSGWASARTLGLTALSLALLAAFTVRQAMAATPLLRLGMLRERAVWGANLIQILLVAALFSFQVLITLYLQRVQGYGALESGMALLPAALAIGTFSLGFAARLITRFGPRAVLLAGLSLLTVGLFLLTRLPTEVFYVRDLLPTLLLSGGFGLAITALTGLGMSAAGPENAGVASGLFNATQQIGGALGVAVLSTLASSRADALLTDGRSPASALTGGFELAFAVGAALLLTALVLSATVLRGAEPLPSDEPASAPALP